MKYVTWLLLLAMSLPMAAAPPVIPPPPHLPPENVVRIWGNAQAAGQVGAWVEAFAHRYPEITVVTELSGSDVAMAGLYTGQADIALLGREATASELQAFEWVHLRKPVGLRVMTGSLDRAGQSPALAVMVHRNNPLRALSTEQLAAIFGTVEGRARVHRWGQLGLSGEWADRRIRAYGPMAESGTGKFFRTVVLDDSNRLNWDALTEFSDPVSAAGVDASAGRIVAALALDPAGIALGNLQFQHPSVRVLALSSGSGPAWQLTRDNLIARRYPLTRTAWVYVHPALAPQVAAFLDFALSPAGQVALPEGGYLPLPERMRQRQALAIPR